MTTRIGEAWPPDELEEVPECPVCGSRDRSVLHGELRDLLFRCAPGLWTFHRCLHCSSPYLDPRPTRSSIGRAYSSYYTHELGSDRGGPLAKVQLRLRYGFLNQTRGYRLSPAGRAGAWVVRMLPQERGRALKEVRHLPGRGGGMRVLDVGCGSGGFLDLMRWPGWIVQGLEPDQEAVDLARRRGLDVMHGSSPCRRPPRRRPRGRQELRGARELVHRGQSDDSIIARGKGEAPDARTPPMMRHPPIERS